jgi:hypothetical protein
MEAKNLADNLKKASGLFNDDGTFNTEKWSEVVDTIEAFGHALLVIVSTGVISKFVSGLRNIFVSASGLSIVLVMGLAFSILQAIDAFRDGDKLGGVFAITIGVTLVGAFIALKGVMIDGKLYLDLFGKTVNGTFLQITMGISMLIGGISLFIKNFDKLSTSAKIWIPIISALAGAIASLAVGFTIMKGNWLGAISIGAMVAGAGLMVGTTLATQDFKNGGVPDRGTIFRAGEAGTEVVSHTNGVTEVTNVRQMEQAFFNALLRHSKTTNGKTEIIVNLDGEKVYKNTTEHAKQHGNTWNKS